MSARQPELHVSALSPAEFKAYTRYLDLIALTQARQGDAGIDPDGTARFDRAVIRDFGSERLDVPKSVVDDVLKIIPGRGRLVAGQVYAVLRMLGHVANPRDRKRIEVDLIFVPVEPLPLDPKNSPPPPPPQRMGSVRSASTSGDGHRRRPSLPPLPPKPPSPPPRRVGSRTSLPASRSGDPFGDDSSGSPIKTRTLSTSALDASRLMASNNPFRAPAAPESTEEEFSGSQQLRKPKKEGPPLPTRKPSVRQRPALPPRLPNIRRQRASSTSSTSTWSDAQPTSTAAPSELMGKSLAAAAAVDRTPKERSVHVIRRAASTSSRKYGDIGAASASQQHGRRDIIDTVNRAVYESGVDPPLPPPQRVPSANGPKRPPPTRPQQTSRSSSAHTPPTPLSAPSSSPSFSAAAEKYKRDYPDLQMWSVNNLLSDNARPSRNPYAMIILNQPITRKDTLYRSWAASRLRFCADGGANRLYDALDPEDRSLLLPTMIKGDLDSIRPEVEAYYISKGVPVKRDGSEYSTDLQKCIEEVEQLEESSGIKFNLLLFGGLSGRFDQTISSVSTMLKLLNRRRTPTFIISEESLAWCLTEGAHLIDVDITTMGQTCGILPLGLTSAYVRTEGLKWNLDWNTSLLGDLSTSNHLLPNPVFVHTSDTVFWTVEIRPALGLPNLRTLSPADEVARGVKELGVGFVRAAGGVGRDLQRRLSKPGPGIGRVYDDTSDDEDDRDNVRLNSNYGGNGKQREYAPRQDDDDEGGYAQLD